MPCENISAQIITSAKKEDAKKSSLHQYFAPNLISKVLDAYHYFNNCFLGVDK